MRKTPSPTVSLVDVASYLPENRMPASWYAEHAESDDLRDNPMFAPPEYRHHSAIDESNVDMIERAAAGLLGRYGPDVLRDVDVLLTHSQMPDLPIVGAGGEVAHRLGMNPEWIIDVHNSGCASFVQMIKLARRLLSSGSGRKALIACSAGAAGKVFEQPEVRKLAQSSVPGDGAAVGLLEVSDRSPVLDVECRYFGQNAVDMTLETDPPRRWWQAGPGEGHVGFNEGKIMKVLARGNRMVPQVVRAVCDRIGVKPVDLDLLITNQPNRLLLRNWDEALELPRERHCDTFHEAGNLFAVAMPHNLQTAIEDGRIAAGDVVMLAGFANAGDFAGAAAIQWGGRPRSVQTQSADTRSGEASS
ncbi:3-oxoacyl-ACP synthase III family protein [Mycolicibacterium thermoresistibile]|jgi:3-oxoacyl-[acyl-carrier-protein] synthase-3|uniref:3-oxoacyl-ACP synthase n=1 Tax=Mycolicibacterium thermoresistibile TaxID=1797 RepID=A0A117IMD1_MYCTH|nr:3-oxoacyl-[acyl-carrier-protein] synthase III C-terminal domain-containing protein [Mycolicibacterium thermoresistibile]GAT15171.1 3-oxoacyl-ACP synthase [Mycolicibacterium thermoresistibile]SNW18337.1 3-oxoacyl-(acyl-carrier-protein) synthase III [Mycolicibacterium thermoresistibile]